MVVTASRWPVLAPGRCRPLPTPSARSPTQLCDRRCYSANAESQGERSTTADVEPPLDAKGSEEGNTTTAAPESNQDAALLAEKDRHIAEYKVSSGSSLTPRHALIRGPGSLPSRSRRFR